MGVRPHIMNGEEWCSCILEFPCKFIPVLFVNPFRPWRQNWTEEREIIRCLTNEDMKVVICERYSKTAPKAPSWYGVEKEERVGLLGVFPFRAMVPSNPDGSRETKEEGQSERIDRLRDKFLDHLTEPRSTNREEKASNTWRFKQKHEVWALASVPINREIRSALPTNAQVPPSPQAFASFMKASFPRVTFFAYTRGRLKFQVKFRLPERTPPRGTASRKYFKNCDQYGKWRGRRTNWGCLQCNIALCTRGRHGRCFEIYHQSRGLI